MPDAPAPPSKSALGELFGRMAVEEDQHKSYSQIAELEAQLTAEQDARKEERFIWIAILMLVVDLFVFTQMSNLGGPIAILILQLLILTVLGRRLGVEDVVLVLNRVIDSWGGRKGG